MSEEAIDAALATDEVEALARTLCNDESAREIADQVSADAYEDSFPVVQEYWRCIARAALRTQSAVSDCPSCGGLNMSCPDGCGRDENGELDGSTLDIAAWNTRTQSASISTAKLVEHLTRYAADPINAPLARMAGHQREAAQTITAQATELAALRERVAALEEGLRQAQSVIDYAAERLWNQRDARQRRPAHIDAALRTVRALLNAEAEAGK